MKKWQRVTLITFSMVFMTLYAANIVAEAKKKSPPISLKQTYTMQIKKIT